MQDQSSPSCVCGCGAQPSVGRRFVLGHHARQQPTGDAAYRWAGGRHTSSRGYAFLWVDSRGYVQEHRLVMEQMVGRRLTRQEVVHHRNHNKLDNRPENLVLVSHQAEHIRTHHTIDGWTRRWAACVECGSTARRHAAHGLCRLCDDRQGKSSDTFQPFLTGRWSRKNDACIECGTTARRHICRGLCSFCYERQRHRKWS